MNLILHTTKIRYRILSQAYRNFIRANEEVLDVGCGNGIITKLIQDDFQTNITGCDINYYLIYKLPFISIKNRRLNKIKKRFNIAMLNDVLHHISKDKQEQILTDCLKIADKILIFEAEPTIYGKLADIILNKHHYHSLKTPLSFRKVNEWQAMFKKMNLKYSMLKPGKPFWYPFSHIAFCVHKT
jgi:SAM-dependent methyltransferase